MKGQEKIPSLRHGGKKKENIEKNGRGTHTNSKLYVIAV